MKTNTKKERKVRVGEVFLMAAMILHLINLVFCVGQNLLGEHILIGTDMPTIILFGIKSRTISILYALGIYLQRKHISDNVWADRGLGLGVIGMVINFFYYGDLPQMFYDLASGFVPYGIDSILFVVSIYLILKGDEEPRAIKEKNKNSKETNEGKENKDVKGLATQ